MARGETPPLIPSCEHRRQAERGRREGSSPVRAVTLVTGSEATRARPEGHALQLSAEDADRLKTILARHLRAIQSSISFWQHEQRNHGSQLMFDLDERKQESALIHRLYLELHDQTKATASKTAIQE